MIFDNADALFPTILEKGESPSDIEQKMMHLINNQDDILIETDLFGGSPFNVPSKLALEHQSIESITGMSLPLYL